MTARFRITAAALVVALNVVNFASIAAADDTKSKKTDLEGTWQSVKKGNGPEQFIFTGNRFEAKFDGRVWKGTFKLTADENPLWIDLKITESTNEKYKGKTALGIYEFQGENIRWCSSQPGRKRRPTQFATQMGDAVLRLGTFKPKKK